jgi:hypothetical protein
MMSTTQIPATFGATQEDIVAKENDMYDTEKIYTDVLRRKTAQVVDWAETAFETKGHQNDVSFETMADRTEQQDLELVVEAKKRDNFLICETLVSVGLLQNREMSRLQTVQAESDDVVGALVLASAIRSRLGEILLQAKCITSSQLEHALEMQRQSGDLLGEILVRLQWLEQGQLDVALVAQAQCKAAISLKAKRRRSPIMSMEKSVPSVNV